MTMLRAALAQTRALSPDREDLPRPDNTHMGIANIKGETVDEYISQFARFEMTDEMGEFQYAFRIE